MQSAGLGRFAEQTVFPIWVESQKEPAIRPIPLWMWEAGVKGRDERKERALDTGLPTPTPLYAFLRPRAIKMLDNADAVIHGATFPKGTFSYGQRTNKKQDSDCAASSTIQTGRCLCKAAG